jgi:hypothetical protein
MRAVLFDNKLLVPKKCGSTYSYNIFTDVVSNEYDIEHLYSIKNTITIVIREPVEHLQSALHTELLGWLFDNPTEKIEPNNMIPLISNFLGNGTTHWDINYYEDIYKFWKTTNKQNKIIHLNQLSKFVEENYGLAVPNDKFSYGIRHLAGKFKYAYTSKEKLSKWIEETLPELWNELVKDLPKAEKFYNHLINETDYIEYDLEMYRKII